MNHREHGEHGDDERTRETTATIIDAGLKAHKILGPGLLESAYEHCLCHELSLRSMSVQRQMPLPINYEGVELDVGCRLDLLVAGCIVVEVKAVEKTLPIHEAQVLTYLKLSGHHIGLLLNFNVPLFKHSLKRFVR